MSLRNECPDFIVNLKAIVQFTLGKDIQMRELTGQEQHQELTLSK